MTDVTIDRFRAKYHTAADPEVERRRLDGMLGRAFESSMEASLELAGIQDSELLCFRALRVPFVADLARTEVELAAAWSEVFATRLRRALDEDGGTVVRYRSPSAALVDIIRRAARGDLDRVWAWTSLGLWDAGEDCPPPVAAGAVVRALGARPRLAARVLETAAAEAATARFLFRHLAAGSWRSLAIAALGASNLPVALAVGPRGRSGARAPRSRSLDRSRDAALVRAGSQFGVAPDARRPLAVLALLAREPAALHRRAEAEGRVARLAERLGPGAVPRPAPSPSGRETRRHDPTDREAGAAAPGGSPEAGTEPRDPRFDDSGDRGPGSLVAATGKEGEAEEARADDATDRRGAAVDGRTRFGGLLFLLHLLEDGGTWRSLADDPVLEGRSLRWTLHRVARELCPASADDPAVLAFCGLGPGTEPPTEGEGQPTPEEREAVESWARALGARLAGRLDQEARLHEQVTAEIVGRRSTVVADPGWIEARFRFRDASTTIRRAGLDLDPDYLEWLGVVVRFAYV